VLWSPHSPVRYRLVISVQGQEARRNALQREPRQSRESMMKQVSVEANLRHGHPPPMSIDVGRKIATSRASMSTKVLVQYTAVFSRAGSGCRAATQWHL
jgi:hypothetical protein